MITRAAKKQKVRFRIACTGTPVENSLADLWCLYDFVQPGFLGALNDSAGNTADPSSSGKKADGKSSASSRESRTATDSPHKEGCGEGSATQDRGARLPRAVIR